MSTVIAVANKSCVCVCVCVCVCARARVCTHVCVFGGASFWEDKIVLEMNGADGPSTSECIQ